MTFRMKAVLAQKIPFAQRNVATASTRRLSELNICTGRPDGEVGGALTDNVL